MGGGRPPYRHSRVSGNPAAERQWAGLFSTVRDSRLRGNDGMTVGGSRPLPLILNLLKDGCDGCYCLFGIPACTGRTVKRAAGRTVVAAASCNCPPFPLQ